jgi:hypothetical protein
VDDGYAVDLADSEAVVHAYRARDGPVNCGQVRGSSVVTTWAL